VKRILSLVTIAALGALVGATVALAHGPHGNGHGQGKHGGKKATTVVYTLDGSHGNPEGVAFDKRSGNFFVSSAGDGSIWRGKVGDTSAPVPVFIPGGAGNGATGMKVFRGRLYVSGAGTGTIKVYDVKTGTLLATFDTTGGSSDPTFINDLVVTRDGDVFATDSFRPALYHLTKAEIAAGTPAAKPIDPADVINTGPEIPFDATPNTFNLNGIVDIGGGRHNHRLVLVDTATGQLFRVKVRDGANAQRRIAEVKVKGGPFVGGDGLLIDRGRLIVVQGSNSAVPNGANGVVNFVKLTHQGRRARLANRLTDPTFRGPSTIAAARKQYLVVNADFGQSRTPFTVSGVPRRHGDHGHHGHHH
jgi:Cu-Zn family superoxide dismutase